MGGIKAVETVSTVQICRSIIGISETWAFRSRKDRSVGMSEAVMYSSLRLGKLVEVGTRNSLVMFAKDPNQY